MRHHIQDIVERYLGRGKFSGESNIMLRCPFHKSGQETNPSFSVNVDLAIWQCFTCKASGGITKLLRMLGLPADVIDAETHGIRDEIAANKERLRWKQRAEVVSRDPFLAKTILPETVLKPYEWLPVNLANAGFHPDWLKFMGIGFDRNNNRITYPIRDIYGNLAGISGGAGFAGQYPKYKVYKGRWKNPETERWVPSDYGDWFDERFPNYDFHNHDFLWNYDSVFPRLFFGREPTDFLIIVEGFKACLWLLQHGFWNTVALMGSQMSDRQFSLINRLSVRVVLFLDQDDAGRKGMQLIGRELRKHQPGVYIAYYPYAEDCQPDDLTLAEVTAAISGAIEYPIWRKQGAIA